MVKEEYILWNEYPCGANSEIYSHLTKKYLKGTVDEDGYIIVRLKCTDGKRRLFKWHRVIWTYFYGAIPEGYEINHLDENKQNNRLSNLSLTSHVENCNWKSRNERIATKRKNHPLLSKQVVAVDKDGVVVMEFPSANEAGRNGFSQSAISACCNNCYLKDGNRFYKGYYWYYLEDWLKINGG